MTAKEASLIGATMTTALNFRCTNPWTANPVSPRATEAAKGHVTVGTF